MDTCDEKCDIGDIPEYLHSFGKCISAIGEEDRLFLWHELIEDPALDGYGAVGIPGYRWENQSANSELLNPNGSPLDVLRDTRQGGYLASRQVACLAVKDIISISFPNPNNRKMGRDGKVQPVNEDEPKFSLTVEHKPTKCMYPHCEIIGNKDGCPNKMKQEGVRSILRRTLAEMAMKYWNEMKKYSSKSNGDLSGESDTLESL